MTASELIAVSSFRSTPEAHVAQGVLEQAGITSMIRSDDVAGMYPAISGVDLLVRAEDFARAAELLHNLGPAGD